MTTPVTPQEPPFNTEAEQAVLGSIMLDAGAMSVTEKHLTGDMFYMARHADIYEAMRHLASKGTPIDIITLSARLQENGRLAGVGGHAYLAELMASIPTPVHAEHYARLVSDAYTRRRVIALSDEIARMAYGTTSTDTVLEYIHTATQSLVPQDDRGMLRWEDSFDFWMRGQEERRASQGKPKFDLPWPSINHFVRHLRDGMLCVVAAEPGIGKTLFAEMTAEHWAKNGFQVLFCHYELSHQVMLDRRIVRTLSEDMGVIEWGTVSEHIGQVRAQIAEWPGAIHYYHCPGMPIVRLAGFARNEIRRGRADVVVVDYLQKAPMWEHTRGMNTAQMRGGDVEALKHLAETENMPVLLMSQMSRASRSMERKTAETLRDSSEIEDKANVVITLNRKILDEGTDGFAEGDRSPHMRVRVDKNTLGRTGETELYADAKHFQLIESERVDLAEDRPPPPRVRPVALPRQTPLSGVEN